MNTALTDKLREFEKVYETHFTWDSQHTAWMFDLETNEWTLVSTKDDPQDLISYGVSCGFYSQGIIVVHGWAAPDGDLIAPSKHEERIRVRIVIHIDNEEVTYAIHMKGGVLTVSESPVGGLMDTLIREGIQYAVENYPNLLGSFAS